MSNSKYVRPAWAELSWSEWLPLDAPLKTYQEYISKEPGFYRVRVKDAELAYIGQTGRNLRERVRSLAINALKSSDNPPWNDPHTVAPILWAYIQENNFQFEVSAAVAVLPTSERQCFEDSLLYLHRVETGESTLCNHGRLHPWWTRPTNKKKMRPTTRRESPVSFESLKPATGNEDYLSDGWLDLHWTSFKPLTSEFPDTPGVYRIKKEAEVCYLGETISLSDRLRTHSTTEHFLGLDVSFSSMSHTTPKHQLLEREFDLIGAYYLKTGHPPEYQY